jgi:hypothetical protein
MGLEYSAMVFYTLTDRITAAHSAIERWRKLISKRNNIIIIIFIKFLKYFIREILNPKNVMIYDIMKKSFSIKS